MTDVSRTIYAQLGGHRLNLMLGCKVWFEANDLIIHNIKASKNTSKAVISYNYGTDLYKITTYKKRKPMEIKDEFDNVFADLMIPLLEKSLNCYITL